MVAYTISDAELIRTLQVRAKNNPTETSKILGLSSASSVRARVELARSRGLKATDKLPPIEVAAIVKSEQRDAIETRRLKDNLRLSNAARVHAEKMASADKTIREAVFGLTAEPLEPPNFNPVLRSVSSDKTGEVAFLMLSDLHLNEVIDLAQMGGINSFNSKIAAKRLERYFQTVIKLCTEQMGRPLAAVYVLLMGDLTSGSIHEELAKTNDLLSMPACKVAAELLAAGIQLLLEKFPKIPFYVVSVPGNHGRTTRKPEAKGFALDSYDTLVAMLLEAYFKNETRVQFSAPASGDALINVYGRNFLVTHGDRIGSRGGYGFVGPAAAIARGFQKLRMDYANQGIIIDQILIGHFHTALELFKGISNGCLPGPSEYSKSGRMDSEVASQYMITTHPRHKIAHRWRIEVGDPSEGSLYKVRAA